MWKFHRSMTRPFFTRERISDFEIYDRNWDLSLKLAKQRIEEGYSIDVQDLVSRFTLDSATEFLFGASVGSLSAGIPYPPEHVENNTAAFYSHPSTTFVKAFTEGLILAAVRTGLGQEWPLAEFGQDKITPLRKTMDEFTEPLMKMALDKREKALAEGVELKDKEEMTLLGHLVNHTQDTKILKDELINLLVAGRDTTMCLLTFAIYMLAEHPDVEKRLRQEIFDIVGPTSAPKYEQMRDMRYTRAFLNEVLRLYPPVPADSRTAIKPVVLPPARKGGKPIYIPKDTTCLYTVLNIHRRTDLWGPDALEFDPDRFLDSRVQKYLVHNPFIFCPFNAGPRICLGQQASSIFAYHEATYYLVRLLQNFTGFTLDQSANVPPPAHWKSGDALVAREKVRPTAHLTMYIKGGLWVQMKELKANEV
uniref:Cytochrome P450 n=1 Tax=Psilocybe cubensis TaxID=181762 RepID=A0A8H7XXG4_PSICU